MKKRILIWVLICFAFNLDLVKAQVNIQDSSALVALYNSTNGANWDTEWDLSQPVSTWYGVTVNSSGRVIQLDLRDNELNGTIPPALGDLDNLINLYLHNNQLNGSVPIELGQLNNLINLYLNNNQLNELPDLYSSFSSLSPRNLRFLLVEDNHLDFGDLIPNLGPPLYAVTYIPQAPVREGIKYTPSEGDDLTLSVDVDGVGNTYKWFKDNRQMFSATDKTLTFTNIQLSDNGEYYCEITNTNVSGLTLESVPDTIMVIVPPNRAPTNIDLSSTTIAENSSIGTQIGILTTTDPDTRDSHIYSLSGMDAGSFQIIGNELRSAVEFNYEGTKNSYMITIETEDLGGLTYEEDFTIMVNDVNEKATDISLTNTTIDENLPAGTQIGTLDNNDPDPGTYTYRLVSGGVYFRIDGTTLKSRVEFNYENNNSYDIFIQASEGATISHGEWFTIDINDVNDRPADITLPNTTIEENLPIGTIIDILSTTDPDDPSKMDSYDYTLSGTDASSFKILGNELQSNRMFDYETKSSYTITIQTQDQDLGRLTYEEDFTINISDANDAPTDIDLSNNNIDENSPAGTLIGTLSTTDQDDPGKTKLYTYTVLGTHASDFRIVRNTLRSNRMFDYETKSSYTITIQTDDGRGGNFEKEFIIMINDVNENTNNAPTNITLSNTAIEENLPTGTQIGILSTTDPDAGDSHTYSLVSGVADNNSFIITGNKLKSGKSFDYENKNSYTITIQTQDARGLTYQEDFTINISDANDAPKDIALSNTAIEENKPVGTQIGILSTTDPDAGDTHTYSILGVDASDFQIVGNQLQSAQMFNYGTKNIYNIIIQTSDGRGGHFEKEFTITIDLINSLEEFDISDKVTIYPNPGSEVVFLEVSNITGEIVLSVSSIEGKVLIKERILKNNKANERHRLYIKKLSAGTYILSLKSGIYFANKKLIKY